MNLGPGVWMEHVGGDRETAWMRLHVRWWARLWLIPWGIWHRFIRQDW